VFYRVDYTLAVLLAGFLIGLGVSRRSSRFTAPVTARAYFEMVLVLLALRLVCLIGYEVQPHINAWNISLGALLDISTLLFGLLFGLALRRADRHALVTDNAVFAALTLTTAFFFAMTGIGKAFSMDWMINFFHQSGYSAAFLKSIMIVEVFAALAMLVPVSMMAAVLVLTVDMFGAIYTHVHNSDPLNDSTDAVRQLIYLAVIAVLWTMRHNAAQEIPRRRIPYATVAAGAVICCLAAIAGGVLMRHAAHP
jgi:uncharacterized membrane protein YphA (DoxX/SURF4 family)